MSKQFAITEVMNYTVQKYSTNGFGGDILYSVDYATDTKVSTSSERLDLRGGQGSYKLHSTDHSKDAAFTATLPLADLSALAEMTGRDLVTGATQVPHEEVLVASATNTITLSQTPITGSLKIYLVEGERDRGAEQTLGTPASNTDEYSIVDKEVTLNATTAPLGTKFKVFYDYQTSATARKITVTANDFPGYVRITGEGLWTDQVEGVTYPVKFDIKKAKVKPGFEWTMAAGEATSIPFEYDLFTVTDATGGKVFFETTILPDAV